MARSVRRFALLIPLLTLSLRPPGRLINTNLSKLRTLFRVEFDIEMGKVHMLSPYRVERLPLEHLYAAL